MRAQFARVMIFWIVFNRAPVNVRLRAISAVSRLLPCTDLGSIARIIHERFCCNRGFAARSVNILFQVCLPSVVGSALKPASPLLQGGQPPWKIPTKEAHPLRNSQSWQSPASRLLAPVSLGDCAISRRTVMNNAGWVQCLDAVVAPMPVSDLTCCARKPPRSFAAWLLRSRIENNQMPTKPIVIENSAGEVYGNNALPFG